MRTIFLSAIDRHISLGTYVQAIKTAKENPNKEYKYGLTCWWPCTGKEILQQFMAGVHDRINQGIPYTLRGKIRIDGRLAPHGARETMT